MVKFNDVGLKKLCVESQFVKAENRETKLNDDNEASRNSTNLLNTGPSKTPPINESNW